MYILKSLEGFYWTGSDWSTTVEHSKRYSTIQGARRVANTLTHKTTIFELDYNFSSQKFIQKEITHNGFPAGSEQAFLGRLERARKEGDTSVVKEMEGKYERLFK